MVNALETNFFFYQSSISTASIHACSFILDTENTRFNRLYAVKASSTSASVSPMLPDYGTTRALYITNSGERRDYTATNVSSGQATAEGGGGLLSMNFPSISDAFRNSDGMSYGLYGSSTTLTGLETNGKTTESQSMEWSRGEIRGGK